MLSYLLMAQALLALVLTTQVIFEWSTAGLKWTTAAACAGAIFVAAVLHYLLRLCKARDGEVRRDIARTQRTVALKLVAFAASMLVGVALAFVVQDYMQVGQVVSTGASQWHDMTLPDGTTVHVDARSEVEVAYTEHERIVYVHEGSAVFEVAKDPKRVFVARTHLIDVIAVGTRFGVAIDPGVTTTVSEGIVKVTGRGKVDGKSVTLQAGEELRVSDSSLVSPHLVRVDADRKLQWAQNGLLVLRDLTVEQGAEQLNRRNRTQIVIDSDRLAARVVTLVTVKVDSPESYARFIAAEPGVHMIVDEDNGVIRLWE